jgi:hypothetical protein
MKKGFIIAMAILILIPLALADVPIVANPTVTNVYFEKNGEHYNKPVEFTMECYGYMTGMPPQEKEPGTYAPEKVFSFLANCPSYGCEIYQGYYTNYRHIDYCNLIATAEGEEFIIKNFSETPTPNCTFNTEGLSGRICVLRFDIPESAPNCQNLYWFDNTHKECSQKQFCGAFMYYGLQTFETKGECESALNGAKKEFCTERKKVCTEEYGPVCGCSIPKTLSPSSLDAECKAYDNSCFACSDRSVDYWTSGECAATNDRECTQDSDCVVDICKYKSCKNKNSVSEEERTNLESTCAVHPNSRATSCTCENNICIGHRENQNEKEECTQDSDCPQSDCAAEADCIGIEFNCINGKCIKDSTNGRKGEVKIMPETASQRAIERLGELNFTVELKEVGNNKVAYELTGNKEGKFLGIFKIMARVKAQVDAETGDVKVIKPWWAFLASGI